jgi:uncharacterized membrane protein YfcA
MSGGHAGADPLQLMLVFAAGLVSGFVNTVAGGGSMLTLPVLIFLGLPAPVANATNRIGILLQNVSASTAFRRAGKLDSRLGIRLAVIAAPGTALGAFLAVDVNDLLFRRILAVVMLLILAHMLLGKRLRRSGGPAAPGTVDPARLPRRPVALMVSFFLAGLYAGFLQAGIGFLLIAILTGFGGYDLVRTNAVKVFTVLFLQALALAIFAAAGKVSWGWGFALAAGAMAGGWAGARWQVAIAEVWVRRFLIACMLAFATRLLFS